MMYYYAIPPTTDEIYHHGVKGMRWGVRKYQNNDGSLTPAGERHYYKKDGSLKRRGKRFLKKQYSAKVYRESKPTKDDPNMFEAGDKAWAFKKKIDAGFAPSKKDFAKYTGPRQMSTAEKARAVRQKNVSDYKKLIQMHRENKQAKRDGTLDQLIAKRARQAKRERNKRLREIGW